MSASDPSKARVAAENELLARLGLPPSATAEDVDQQHLAVSKFLAAAPASLKGWARAQAASLDEAYLTLTDPVGLEGSALRSPTRPPTVVPGGPATPPARRDPVPAIVAEAPAEIAPAAASDAEMASVDDTDTDDLDLLFASVTPGAHRDLTTGGKTQAAPVAAPVAAAALSAAPPTARRHTRQVARSTATVVAPAPSSTSAGPWKMVAILTSAVLAVVVMWLVVIPLVFNLGGSGSSIAAAPTATAPAVDQAKVSALMAKIQANPNDTVSLQALGDEFYQGQEYTQAANFYDKLLALDAKNIKALLARGAVYFNVGDMTNAEKIWRSVISLNPSEKSQLQEAHYDLGFLYMNQDTPDWTKVATEWQAVIDIDGTSQLAQLVQQHITSLVKASMIPASLAPASSASPAGSGAASPAASGSAPAASAAPSASAAAGVVDEGAQNLAFTSNQLNAPANAAFTIRFNNQDSGLPHDILIKDANGKTVFQGDMVTGPTTVDYQVPALAAGTYTFTCSIHPTTMNGTLKVGS